VIAPDFVSLYPNATRSFNGCLSTYLTEESIDCHTVPIINIDTTTDDITVENTYYYSKQKGIIPELIDNLFAKRTQLKAEMKRFSRDSMQYNALNVS
jgi:DNA polymerase elongation subunit (family B)